MRILDVLKGAREVISKPENWIQGELRNGHGGFCARGAIMNVMQGRWSNEQIDAEQALFTALNKVQKDRSKKYFNKFYGSTSMHVRSAGSMVAGFNNSSTHEEVLELFDLAISRQLVIDSRIANAIPTVDEPVVELRAALLVGV